MHINREKVYELTMLILAIRRDEGVVRPTNSYFVKRRVFGALGLKPHGGTPEEVRIGMNAAIHDFEGK